MDEEAKQITKYWPPKPVDDTADNGQQSQTYVMLTTDYDCQVVSKPLLRGSDG